MNIYERITSEIIKAIETEKILPWQKPWSVIPAKNLVSGKTYRGFNAVYLNSLPFKSPFWMTFLQCKTLGGKVKAGEKSRMVIYWERSTYEDRETGEQETGILSKYYQVFNLDQTEGIPEEKIPKLEIRDRNPIEEAERILRDFPNKPEIRFHNQDKAYYSPSQDLICLPPREYFKKQEEFYGTFFHESVHATGHVSRLNRKGITEKNRFGSEEYSKEELVAELGAAFLCAESGIVNKTINNSAAYLQSWLQALKADPRLIVHASQGAEKAAKYILNRKEE